MRKQIVQVTLPICGAILVAGSWLAKGGSLTPPVGPIGSTMKDLDTVEPRTPISTLPFTINGSGSYFLTQSLTGAGGQNGITIDADDVTLDLNGFTLQGVAGSLDGVQVVPGRNNITIQNGGVSNWDGDGVDAVSAQNSLFANLRLASNGGTGLVTGDGGTVAHCTAKGNGGSGIHAQNGGVVMACAAVGNQGLAGILVESGSTVSACSARSNLQHGIHGDAGVTIIDCTASDNANHGIEVISDCRVVDNTCDSNGVGGFGAGVHVTGNDNRIQGNNATNNDIGIDVDGTGNLILRNSASDSTGGPIWNITIVGGNAWGPVVTVSGDLAGIANADHPWANFSY